MVELSVESDLPDQLGLNSTRRRAFRDLFDRHGDWRANVARFPDCGGGPFADVRGVDLELVRVDRHDPNDPCSENIWIQ